MRKKSSIDAGLMNSGDVVEGSQALWAGCHGFTALLIACPSLPFVEQERLVERMLDTLISRPSRRVL